MWESISGCALQLQLHSLSHCSLPSSPSAGNEEISVAPPSSAVYFCLASLSHCSHFLRNAAPMDCLCLAQSP